MGKILLTNNFEWHSKLDECFQKHGFKRNGNYSEGIMLTTYEKKNVATYNFYKEGNDFIACSGTLIYENSIGEEAIKKIFYELKLNKINEVRKKMLGTFVIIYKMENQLRVFLDEAGTYAFYYSYQENGKYILTNTFYHIQKCLRNDFNKYAFMEQILEFCIINNETPFKEIYRIMGNECIVIDIIHGTFSIEVIEANHYILQEDGYENIVNKLENTIKGYAKRKKGINEKLYIFATGGVDSRIALAANLSEGIPTVVCNWQGCPKDMNTKVEDYDIVKEISEKLGLESICYNVAHDNLSAIKNIEEDMFDCYGDYCRIYGSNKKWFEIFEKNGIKSTDFGYFGEILKSWDALDNLAEFISIEEYAQLYMRRNGYDLKDASYQKYILNKLKKIAIENNLDVTRLSKEDCMRLYYIYRIHADTVIDNFANMFSFSFSLFAQKEIAEYVHQVPYSYKEKFKLNLELTRRLYSKLVELNYFTHCRFVQLDKSSMVLEEGWKYKFTKFVRFVLLGNKIGEKLITKARKVNQPWTVEYVKQIKKTGIMENLDIEIKEDTFGYLPIYVLILFHCRIVQMASENGLKDV